MNDKIIPTVSVIIPTYNRAHLIGRSIRSVLNQTFGDFEIIVVDDGSTDNTEDIIRATNDPRIIFIKHPKNRGVSAARNTGIKSAKGKFIAFQDSDDEWFPQKLEKQLALFKEDKAGDLGLVVCGYLMITNNQQKRLPLKIRRLNYEQLLIHFGGYGEATQRFLLKRDLVASELYFDEKLRAWEEWDLIFRISRISRIDSVREPLVKYYRQSESHLDVPRNRIPARKFLLRKYAKELATNNKGLSYGYWQIALDYQKIGKMRHVKYYLKKAIQVNPWNPDYYFQYTAAVFGYRSFKLTFSFRHAVIVVITRASTFLHKFK